MTAYRICPICEAACGLKIDTNSRSVVGVRANDDDIFSQGHVCAKGIALKELDADPDRIRTPMLRKDGKLLPVSWEDAWLYIAERLNFLRRQSGNGAVAAYLGNPTAHNIGLTMGMGTFLKALGTPQIYTAGTVDQVPKQLASALMFGNPDAVPVPDIERCDMILMLGANPVVSNGSLWVVPKIRERLRAFTERGGRLVTIDPRRSETARLAAEHHFITPGSDAWLLLALSNELRALGCDLPANNLMKGRSRLAALVENFTTPSASARTGVSEASIRTLARQLHEAKAPVLYGRVGTTLQRHGTLTSFLIEVLNLQIGALDCVGGAMFPEQPYHRSRPNAEVTPQGRWHTRVSGRPEVLGQLPVAAMAEEIQTPGDGQVRALFCIAGNPLVSTPDSNLLQQAFESLDLLVCCDLYHSETTKLADVILPGTSPFEDGHYDHFLGAMGYKNAARYSPPVFHRDSTPEPDEWDMGLTLGHIAATGRVPTPAELAEFEDNQVAEAVAALIADQESGIAGEDAQRIMGLIEPRRGVERLLDLGIRAGRWGDHFGKREGLTLQNLIDTPNGIELGTLRDNRLQEIIGFADRKIELAPALMVDALQSLAEEQLEVDQATPERHANKPLLLIGRRNVRSNNSWLRNLPMLVRGKPLCTLQLNPLDAADRSIADGDSVLVASDTASIEVVAELDDALMAGVVSLPHGFSTVEGLAQSNLTTGANYNALASNAELDAPSGTAALNGLCVQIEKIELEKTAVGKVESGNSRGYGS